MRDYVIGVDVGGTNIRLGAVDHQANILARGKTATEAKLGSESILNKISDLVRGIKDALPDHRLKAIGFGIPAAVRSRDGVVMQAPNIKAWETLPIQKTLQERLDVFCVIENDANAITVGEMWVGAGRGYQHICCLTLGTGVGGGVIIDGELLRGADGMAAELGHIGVKMDGALCNCGSYGCLETFASATGIRRLLKEALATGRPTSLKDLKTATITTETIYRHALHNDAVATAILHEAAVGLGAGMASLINVFNPEVFIIGGGVAGAWDLLMPPALEVMNKRAFRASAARTKIVRAEKEDDAGIYGSAYIAWDALQKGKTLIAHERRLTPWGFWEVIEEGPDYKVKRLYIHPGHRLSYQRHEQREETWMIATGEAVVILDDHEQRLKPGDTIRISKRQAHRIGNPLDQPLVFFEVQRGTYFGEDDIVRLHDDYSRNDKP